MNNNYNVMSKFFLFNDGLFEYNEYIFKLYLKCFKKHFKKCIL